MSSFDVAELPVTAVTGHHDHGGARGLDLLHFSAAVIHPFFVIAGGQGPAAAAAADLILPGRIEVDPVFEALRHDPARFLVIPVSEQLFRFTAVIAGIMVGCRSFEAGFIQFDSSLFYIPYKKIEYRDKFKFFKKILVSEFLSDFLSEKG